MYLTQTVLQANHFSQYDITGCTENWILLVIHPVQHYLTLEQEKEGFTILINHQSNQKGEFVWAGVNRILLA